jgi:hypothetical protein
MKRPLPLVVAIAAVAVVVLPYLALGGASYEPTPVADPCAPRELRPPSDLPTALEQVALSALDDAACALGSSREELVLAVRDEASLDAFADARGVSRAETERALQEGLDRALAEAEETGTLDGPVGSLVRTALEQVPVWLLLDALETLRRVLP